MPPRRKSLYVDTADPSLQVSCPRCGLVTARFGQYCLNCGYQLWPSPEVAATAFRAWQEAAPERQIARQFDLELPIVTMPPVVDYEARAHELGIHIFPNSNNPFTISVGAFFVMLGIIPFPLPARIGIALLGLLILLWGVVGWVIREDVRFYEESAESGAGH